MLIKAPARVLSHFNKPNYYMAMIDSKDNTHVKRSPFQFTRDVNDDR